jgi:hypothetical protein
MGWRILFLCIFLHSFKIMGKKPFWWNWFTIDTVIDCSIYTIYIIIITSHLLLIEINYLINFNVVLYHNCTINEHLTAVIVLYHWNNSLWIMLHSILVWFGSMMLNATFNNISVISWWSVLLVEETGVLEKTIDLSHVTDKCLHSDTLLWFQVNHSLLLQYNSIKYRTSISMWKYIYCHGFKNMKRIWAIILFFSLKYQTHNNILKCIELTFKLLCSIEILLKVALNTINLNPVIQ